MKRFWIWLREFANKQVRASYGFGLDLKCEHCLHWISEGYPLKAIRDRDTLNPVTTCGRCGKDTHWTDCGIIWAHHPRPSLADEGEKV